MFMESAACEKSIACSTCHVILDEAVYDQLEEPSDDENDSTLCFLLLKIALAGRLS